MSGMSKTEKIPATKISGLLYSLSLILIVSPAFLLLLGSRFFPSMAASQLQVASLIPMAAGIVLYIVLRLRKLI